MAKLGKGKFSAKIDKMYLRWFAYALVLLLISLLQASPRMLPTVGGAHPLPLISAVVCFAMFEGPLTGAGIGIGAGCLWALYTERLFGFDALLLMIVGCTCGLLVQLLIRNNWMSALLLNAATIAAYTLIDWLVRYVLFAQDGAFHALWYILLPNALYTLILSPLVYLAAYGLARSLRETV